VALRKSIGDLIGPAPLRIDWRRGLPDLTDGLVSLRELRRADAPSLLVHLHRPRVLQHIAPCPSSTDAFVRFIRWTHAERRRGALACYGIVPSGHRDAVGIIQVWPIERDFSTAEWGFVLGEAFWGTEVFARAARLALDEVFAHLGVYRLEARAAEGNAIGNRALERLGAVREGILRGGFQHNDVVRNHVMWSILAPEWPLLRRRTVDAH